MVMRVVKHVFPVSEGHLDNFIRGAPIEKADLSQVNTFVYLRTVNK